MLESWNLENSPSVFGDCCFFCPKEDDSLNLLMDDLILLCPCDNRALEFLNKKFLLAALLAKAVFVSTL